MINDAVHLVERSTGVHLDMMKIDYNDKKSLIPCTGKTEGVFQLESGGMKNFMKELSRRA